MCCKIGGMCRGYVLCNRGLCVLLLPIGSMCCVIGGMCSPLAIGGMGCKIGVCVFC